MRAAHRTRTSFSQVARRRSATLFVALAVAVAAIAGCDKTDHESIDEWLQTQRGPSKLSSAMKDGDLSTDLRSHAAVNLIRIGRHDEVYAYLSDLGEGDRSKLVAAMVPRLWETARVEGKLTVPSPHQYGAKDALFFLREHADASTRAQIDAHLVDWLTGGQYAGRASTGVVQGAQILRAVGEDPAAADKAADKLIAAMNSVIAAPPGEGGAVLQISDELLLGMSALGSPKAVAKLIEVFDSPELDEKHNKLKRRTLIAMERAFVDAEMFEKADPRALVDKANMARIIQLASDPDESLETASIALNLIRAAGMPACLDALVPMIPKDHPAERFRWVVAKRALDCGQIAAIVPVAEAFPDKGEFSQASVDDALVQKIAAMTPRAEVAKKARLLLKSENWLARIVGVEVLAKLALHGSAAEDAALVRALASDRQPLRGWWGDQSDLPKRERKKTPTLGQRAADVAKQLEELAKTSKK